MRAGWLRLMISAILSLMLAGAGSAVRGRPVGHRPGAPGVTLPSPRFPVANAVAGAAMGRSALRARLPGSSGAGADTLSKPAGVTLSIPSIGLRVAVTDYTDCSGSTPMTRSTAVQFACTPDAVLAIMGHNPGIFTPLLQARPGDQVIYSVGAAQSTYVIRSSERMSPEAASRAGEDGSYAHMVLATCAAPDASSYWVFEAALTGGPGPGASAGHRASSEPSTDGQSSPAPNNPGPGPSPTAGSGPAPRPRPSPSPSASAPPQGPLVLPSPPPL